jgi:hypothetical protein
VLQTNASTLAAVPASAQTVVVRVDEVLVSPPVFVGYAGQDVTVLLAVGEQVALRQQATFYTNSYVLGENLAVQSVGHQDVMPAAASITAAAADPARAMIDRAIRARISSTDTVVTGMVTATHRSATAQTDQPLPSEHSPDWHDADVTVSGVEKGSLQQSSVVIRYPNSTDVRWYNVPKLRPGQTGVFLLHPSETAAPVRAVGAGISPEPATFVLLHPEDYQPIDQLPRIRTLISHEG